MYRVYMITNIVIPNINISTISLYTKKALLHGKINNYENAMFKSYKLPISLKRLSFSGKGSLKRTGSARNSTVFKGILPKALANLSTH